MPEFMLIGLCEPQSEDTQAAFDEWFIDQHAPAEGALRSIHRHLVRQAEDGTVAVDQETLADPVDPAAFVREDRSRRH